MTLPATVAHADWGVSPKKRWVAVATLGGDGLYEVEAPRPVGLTGTTAQRMHAAATPAAPVLLGFDFPIGLPMAYAARVGVDSFPAALDAFGSGVWLEFWTVAATEAEIGPHRPFYPMRPGGTRQAHLTRALGLPMTQLTRLCERGTADGRRAACALFWTLGGNQVGKGALSGWREMLQPARGTDGGGAALWPFDGPLSTLLDAGRLVIAETYPTEFYGHLGIRFTRALGGKRSAIARAAQAHHLIDCADHNAVALSAAARAAIEGGFGTGIDGEDRFDAIVGLLGMLNVVLGNRAAGDPPPGPATTVEGWILGQTHDPAQL